MGPSDGEAVPASRLLKPRPPVQQDPPWPSAQIASTGKIKVMARVLQISTADTSSFHGAWTEFEFQCEISLISCWHVQSEEIICSYYCISVSQHGEQPAMDNHGEAEALWCSPVQHRDFHSDLLHLVWKSLACALAMTNLWPSLWKYVLSAVQFGFHSLQRKKEKERKKEGRKEGRKEGKK